MSAIEKKLSVVIPMFNEEENVEPLITEVQEALQFLDDYETIVVDDCSHDQTYAKLVNLKKQFPKLKILKHKQNSGQSASVITGVKHANYDWIATLDGDGQNDPRDIQKLFQIAQEHLAKNEWVLVAGHRTKRQDNYLKKFSTKIANRVRAWLLKDNCPDSGCGLKVFPKKIFLSIPLFNHVHRFLPALFKRQGLKVINVPVNHRFRLRGQSKYGVWNRLWVGIVDLLGVAWLQRRACTPVVEQSTDA